MCLAVLALRPLLSQAPDQCNWIVVANRDESHERPSEQMHPWSDDLNILAGRDLRAGGGWLGVHRDGRFALLTNYREPGFKRDDAPSRGDLVEQYLKQSISAPSYLAQLASQAKAYNGFNLLLGLKHHWWHASNRADPFSRMITQPSIQPSPEQIETIPFDLTATPRVYGLSNALFDTPWPKVIRTRQGVLDCLQHDRLGDPWKTADKLSAVFQDQRVASDEKLPNTGLPLDRERLLSAPFIKSPTYGTRCTTVVMQMGEANLLVQEISYQPDGSIRNKVAWQSLNQQPWQRANVNMAV